MKNFVTKPVLYVALGLSVISCKSFQHTHRLVDVDRKQSVSAELQVDVEISPDFTKRIKGQSNKRHKAVQLAKDEAYYNAIIDNEVDVLVAPIYSVTKTKRILFVFGGKAEATVYGYAGTYKMKTKAEKDEASVKKTPCGDDCFDKKLQDLTKLSKIDGVLSSEEQKVYKINQNCCGDGKNVEPLSLLTVTTNKSSLVDTYEKVLKVGSSNNNSSTSLKLKKFKFPKFSSIFSKK
jgi:hypothetical protein